MTDRRLLVLRLGEATDKVTELTHAVPISYVVEVRSEVGKSVGMKAVAHRDFVRGWVDGFARGRPAEYD